MTATEKLSTIPIRIIENGKSIILSDGRILLAFNDTLYLIPVCDTTFPPLPRLYIDGKYVTP